MWKLLYWTYWVYDKCLNVARLADFANLFTELLNTSEVTNLKFKIKDANGIYIYIFFTGEKVSVYINKYNILYLFRKYVIILQLFDWFFQLLLETK